MYLYECDDLKYHKYSSAIIIHIKLALALWFKNHIDMVAGRAMLKVWIRQLKLIVII